MSTKYFYILFKTSPCLTWYVHSVITIHPSLHQSLSSVWIYFQDIQKIIHPVILSYLLVIFPMSLYFLYSGRQDSIYPCAFGYQCCLICSPVGMPPSSIMSSYNSWLLCSPFFHRLTCRRMISIFIRNPPLMQFPLCSTCWLVSLSRWKRSMQNLINFKHAFYDFLFTKLLSLEYVDKLNPATRNLSVKPHLYWCFS